MSNCGCGNNQDCGCGNSTPKRTYGTVCLDKPCPQPDAIETVSNKGKFFDKTTEPFVVPLVGKAAWLSINDASLWAVGQFIAINLGSNSIAVFKILERTNKKIKLLNGCDTSGVNGILGNPAPGSIIATDSTFYAIPPSGCSSGEATRIINILSVYGVAAVQEMLANLETVCFTNVPDVSEDESVHLFGGSKPEDDCDCNPDVTVSSCLRKIRNIITNVFATTFCFKQIPEVDNFDPIEGEGGGNKRWAIFMPGTNCLVAGPEISDEDTGGGSSPFSKPKNYAVVNYSTSSGNGGNATAGSWLIRQLNSIQSQSTDFITLASNVITILKPGIFRIDWISEFYETSQSQSRIINNIDSGEVYYGTPVYSGGLISSAQSNGCAIITVNENSTKALKMEYRVSNGAGDLGYSPGWADGRVFASVRIQEI